MQKQNLFLGSAHCMAQKQSLFFGLCTLRSGHSKLVFYTLHTAEHKISICFCILQRNES